MNRQRLLLAILAGELVLCLVYAFWAMPRQQQAPPRTAPPASKPVARGPAAAKAQPPAGRLDLAPLAGEAQPFPGSGRDIFRFRGGWAPVVPVEDLPAREAEPPPPPPPPPTPEQLLQQALASYRVLGFLDKGGVRSVFLASGQEVFVVKPGSPFGAGARYLVTAITASELVVSAADGTATVRLPLGVGDGREPAVMAPVSVPRPEVEAAPPQANGAARPGRRLRPRPGPPPGDDAMDIAEPGGGDEASEEHPVEQPSGEEE